MLAARGLRRLAAAICLARRSASAVAALPAAGAARFHDYDAAVTECIERRALRVGRQVRARMVAAGYRPALYLATRLVIMYARCGALGDARNVLDEMPERNVVSWTAMISGYSQNERPAEALELFITMLRAGCEPNEFTLASVLTSCTGSQGSALLDMYAKSENVQEARRVFDMLPARDVVSYTAIISGYTHLGLDEEALDLFRQLYNEGMQCNQVTFTALLNALSGLASLDYGKQVHGLILRKELPFFMALQNSLIDMYSKCGKLLYSRRVFDNMPERSVTSWNAILMGYGRHGLAHEVAQLFRSMPEEVNPDSVTLLAVLSGYSHGGLVDEGLDMFDLIVKAQRTLLNIEHYGCVIDLLGRSGRLQKALNLIQKMPFEPTRAIWGSLLGACRVHVNIPVGELVARKLLDIEPENAGNYVILSNIYAAAGMWKDVFRVRKLMLKNTVIKEPGRSWMILDKVIHTFHSSERFHPRKEDINAKVKEIYVDIKAAGFVPDLSCVLHDVDDEQKEHMFLGHSTLALSLRHHCHVLRVEEWMSHKLEPEGGGLPMSKTTLANCGWKSI
ncbi:putative pentatricopeptide repeat-containing protein [Panicum miliaceum]|uniref:Pentatricopeptide repeat-containing protein n=1 Tax=Panicum miliaceum TaxID=4540 RepID=A0A3L6PIY2_PANMI|nr:putative pentatricopeptide repeat-containing protein [Panicum miliaceum]